ncbi:MAG: cysteine rich repeat-containing protein [bacterium]
MRKSIFRIFAPATVWLSVLLVLPGLCAAQAKEQDPCTADAEKFCQGVEPGQGRILNCLGQHQSELSPACRERITALLAKVHEKVGAMKEACGKDVDRLCQDVPQGGGRVLECLREHKSELSQECGAFLTSQAEARIEAWKETCGKDAEQFCKDVAEGQGRILECLEQHRSEVSQECREHLPM